MKRVSHRAMSLKLGVKGVMLNVGSGYAPKVGCELEEKEKFWREMDEVSLEGAEWWMGQTLTDRCRRETGEEEVMVFRTGMQKEEGQTVVDSGEWFSVATSEESTRQNKEEQLWKKYPYKICSFLIFSHTCTPVGEVRKKKLLPIYLCIIQHPCDFIKASRNEPPMLLPSANEKKENII